MFAPKPKENMVNYEEEANISDDNWKQILNKVTEIARSITKQAYFLKRFGYSMVHKGNRGKGNLPPFPIYREVTRHGRLGQSEHTREGEIIVTGVSGLEIEPVSLPFPFDNSTYIPILKSVKTNSVIHCAYTKEKPIGTDRVTGERNCYYHFMYTDRDVGTIINDGIWGSNDPERIPLDTVAFLRGEMRDATVRAKTAAYEDMYFISSQHKLVTAFANILLLNKLNRLAFPDGKPYEFRYQDKRFPIEGFSSYIVFNKFSLDHQTQTLEVDIEELLLYVTAYLTPTWPVTIGVRIWGKIELHPNLTVTHDLYYEGPFNRVPSGYRTSLAGVIPPVISLDDRLGWEPDLTGDSSFAYAENIRKSVIGYFHSGFLPSLNLLRVNLLKERNFFFNGKFETTNQRTGPSLVDEPDEIS